jgi:ribosome-binding protein aMBF1 (putative translation factor)
MSIYQDWEPVVLTKNKNKASSNSNSNNLPENKKMKELLVSDDIVKPIYVSYEQSKVLIEGRNAKKWKQLDLAKACNIDVSIIKSYENNTAVFSKSLYNRLLKTLGLSVPSK